MAQHEQSQLFPEPFNLSSIPLCFFPPFAFSFLAVLLGWIRTSRIYLGLDCCATMSFTGASTRQVSQGFHRVIQRGLLNAHYAAPNEKVVYVWVDIC